MKNKALRFRTDQLTEAADSWYDWYKTGCELEEIGRLVQRMALHVADLQRKVDRQAEELKRHQEKGGGSDEID